MNGLFNRALRAALLDRKPFNDWLFEGSATADAAILVIAVVATRMLVPAVAGGNGLGAIASLLPVAIQGLAGWVFLGAATWFAGTRLFDGSGDWQTVLRLQGLAFLPNLLAIGGALLGLIGYLWYLAAATVATGIALSQDRKNALLSVLTGAAILFVVELLLQTTFTGVSDGLSAIVDLF